MVWKAGMIRRLATFVAWLAAAMLPGPTRAWGRAMAAETAAISASFPALLFALGCLGSAVGEALRIHLLGAAEGGPGARASMEIPLMATSSRLLDHPRRLGALCAAAATALGFAYLATAGAPMRYPIVNGGALGLGLLFVLAVAWTPRPGQASTRLIGLGLALALLLVSLFGLSADGMTRWISVGGLQLQPSSFLIPLIALAFVRTRDGPSLLAVLVAAIALALQPDRALAGALMAGMLALLLIRPSRIAALALAAAAASFVVTLVRADPSPAVPFVDQIFYSSFAVHPLAGIAVLGGAALMLVPALVGLVRDPANRAVYGVFGALWLAVIVAAALGNYPTPLVGYGGSAIIGYAISLVGLPPRSGAPVAADPSADRDDAEVEAGRHEFAMLSAPA